MLILLLPITACIQKPAPATTEPPVVNSTTNPSNTEPAGDYTKASDQVISWEEAGKYIGQNKIVEGVVISTYYGRGIKNKPTFLDFHKSYQSHFKCVIWGSDRDKFVKAFPPNPETYFLNKHVQVDGLLKAYPEGSGVPEMILTDPWQIKVVEK
jgi:hypothetical protein